jgi:hypothetical protein
VSVALIAASMALVAGCGSDDTTSAVTVATKDPTEVASTSAAPATTIDTSSTTTTAAPADPTTTTIPTDPSSTGALEIPIPAGSFDVGATDVFVLQRNGDLELWSGALAASPGSRTLVADYPDPFGAVTEGPGPNSVDHVAGVVDGAVVFGDCCEPISGNILAATAAGDTTVLAGGYSPTLSPDGDLLGTANDYVIAQTATDGDGAGVFRMVNQDPGTAYLNVVDLTWSANETASADDDHLVLLGWTDDGWALHDVDRSTLELIPTVDLDILAVDEAPDTVVRFAGHGPDGEVVVAERSPGGTRLRFFAASTLAEMPLLERSLPGTATSIRIADDGVGLLWVDGGTLYHLPTGEFEATALGSDVLAAWFATSSTTTTTTS